MSASSKDCDEKKDWPEKNELAFLNMLHERTVNDPQKAPIYKPADWEAMNREMIVITGIDYRGEKLKAKYHRLRIKTRMFSQLLAHTGVTWNENSNIVEAPDEVWEHFNKLDKKHFNSFRKSGCKNYFLLCQIFNHSIATGILHYASTQQPPTMEEEHELEDDFMNGGTKSTEQVGQKRATSENSGDYQVGLSEYSSDDSFEADLDYTLDFLAISFITEFERTLFQRMPCRTSALSGRAYITEVLNGHPARCFENFRMKPHVFRNLCDRLKRMNLLKERKDVSLEESVAICLSILSNAVSQRNVAERFQHSTGTISHWFNVVLRAIASLSKDIIKPSTVGGSVQPEIRKHKQWYPYFKNCIGALDGTHVAACAPASRQNIFRGRKGATVTQNVLAVCSHNMMFTFVYTGWEGTANDSRIFMDAVSRPENEFPLPLQDHYYLVDSGFSNIPGFLTPYRGHIYHLRDFRGRRGFKGKEEFFNHRHSSCRNVIERTFGVLKKRFPILKHIYSYPLLVQRLIPIACCVLHNFIRMQDQADEIFTEFRKEDMIVEGEDGLGVEQVVEVDSSQTAQMRNMRDELATRMWNDYQRRNRRRT